MGNRWLFCFHFDSYVRVRGWGKKRKYAFFSSETYMISGLLNRRNKAHGEVAIWVRSHVLIRRISMCEEKLCLYLNLRYGLLLLLLFAIEKTSSYPWFVFSIFPNAPDCLLFPQMPLILTQTEQLHVPFEQFYFKINFLTTHFIIHQTNN